jgi:hypothetical protein
VDRTAKLYRLYAEQAEVAHHDLLIKSRTDIRAEIAELESVRRQH